MPMRQRQNVRFGGQGRPAGAAAAAEQGRIRRIEIEKTWPWHDGGTGPRPSQRGTPPFASPAGRPAGSDQTNSPLPPWQWPRRLGKLHGIGRGALAFAAS